MGSTAKLQNFSHRLELQTLSEEVSPSGELSQQWTIICSVWGALFDKSVIRDEQAQQMRETINLSVLIRYRDDVANGWRFLLGERELTILTVHDPDETKRFLSCRCEEQGR